MGTKAIVARPDENGGFAGRIVLNDGEPQYAIEILRSCVHYVTSGDVADAARLLIDEHPAGWIDLPDADSDGRCLCHGAQIANGPASTELRTDQSSAGGEVEFVYVLHPDRLQILAPGQDGWQETSCAPWTD